MHMITMRLVGPGTHPAPATLTELLMARFTPADRVEHLWTRVEPGRIDLVLFLLADCEAEALLAARAACLRAIEHTPRLTTWRLSDDPHANGTTNEDRRDPA
ncbi:hypothetical protein ACIRO3_31045 [Streptomyces sp. NPDC102278]|uniref:hypothetical protein n=1 Tax=Streptomyces sp. NPDC102278 TaxID=3366152 RepID=UPI00381160C0